VTQKLMQFCSIEMGSFYLDVIKDRQYTAKADSLARRSCQTALYHIAEALVRWMAPIMSFTADEIWAAAAGRAERVRVYPGMVRRPLRLAEGESLDDAFWAELLKVRQAVNKALEAARNDKVIGGGLEAEVTLFADEALATRLAGLADELRFVLLTSRAVVRTAGRGRKGRCDTELAGPQGLSVAQSDAAKCDRCWHHVEDVGSHEGHEEHLWPLCVQRGRVTAKFVGLPDEAIVRYRPALVVAGHRRHGAGPGDQVVDRGPTWSTATRGWRSPPSSTWCTCTTRGRPSASWPIRVAGSAGSSPAWPAP
jgi:isoleucyl-tRNA synthetase